MSKSHGKHIAVPKECYCKTTIQGRHTTARVVYAYRGGQVTIYVWDNIHIEKALGKYFTDSFVRVKPENILGFINSPFT